MVTLPRFVFLDKLYLRAPTNSPSQFLAREILVWSRLHHPNIVEFMGFLFGDAGFPVMVSKWAENGNALSYVKRNPGIDVFPLVCIFVPPFITAAEIREGVGDRARS